MRHWFTTQCRLLWSDVRAFSVGIAACLAVIIVVDGITVVAQRVDGGVRINGVITPILAAAGSLAAPGFSFAGDPDTGFANEIANTISVVLGGGRAYLFQAGSLNMRSDTQNIVMGLADDLTISRRAANEFGLSAVLFAALGTPANGTFAYCSDCTIANPCAGGGTGAFAKRLNGVWVCN